MATLVLLVRVVVLVLPVASGWIVVTALGAGTIADDAHRWLAGMVVCVGLPLLVRWRTAVWLAQRGKHAAPPSRRFFLVLGNLALTGGLAFGFADDVGRALRRHGDWFVGERNGAMARHVRRCVQVAALYLESFDPIPDLAPVVLAAPPPVEGDPPPPRPVSVWVHPLAGPERALPGYAIRRFGARRPRSRPVECELGHCGVDIGSVLGQPVYAVSDGVVDKVNKNPGSDAISGIYVVLSHKDGRVRSRYVHLDSVEEGLAAGDTIRAGERIGRLGRTGVRHSGPHLHFGLSIRENGRERFIDPEPYLRTWRLVEPEDTRVAGR